MNCSKVIIFENYNKNQNMYVLSQTLGFSNTAKYQNWSYNVDCFKHVPAYGDDSSGVKFASSSQFDCGNIERGRWWWINVAG